MAESLWPVAMTAVLPSRPLMPLLLVLIAWPLAGLRPGMSVLDLASGTGNWPTGWPTWRLRMP